MNRREALVKIASLGACLGAAALPGLTLPAQAPQGPVVLAVEGRGVQVYRCQASGASAGWVLDHPEADLLGVKGKVIGHHDAGPSWTLEDGSSVKGEPVEKTAAPEAGAVPWLLLRVSAHAGSGVLSGVETIRRTQTHGGVAPVQGCDAAMIGATVRVPYSAAYTFYGRP